MSNLEMGILCSISIFPTIELLIHGIDTEQVRPLSLLPGYSLHW